MDAIPSLSRIPDSPSDLKPEAAMAAKRDPHGNTGRKRGPRRKPNEPDEELEVDTFEHVTPDPRER